MKNKSELLSRIVSEFLTAQREGFRPASPEEGSSPFPLMLPAGDGRFFPATGALMKDIRAYAEVVAQNSEKLRRLFTIQEREKFMQYAIAEALSESPNMETCDEPGIRSLKRVVEENFNRNAGKNRLKRDWIFGCLLLPDCGIYPIRVGPVTFETQEGWLHRVEHEGILLESSVKTIRSLLCSNNTSPEKSGSQLPPAEVAIISAIRDSPVVCTVSVPDGTERVSLRRASTAAKLAITSISLFWPRPSFALRSMGLAEDMRTGTQTHVYFREGRYGGHIHTSKTPPLTPSIDSEEWRRTIDSYEEILATTGQVLHHHVGAYVSGPNEALLDIVLLSLLFFYRACTEEFDQLATANFVASMDALTGGNEEAGITRLVQYAMGSNHLKDGRPIRSVVGDLYTPGRSRVFHGTTREFAYDWSQRRLIGEVFARSCLIGALQSVDKNPNATDFRWLYENGER